MSGEDTKINKTNRVCPDILAYDIKFLICFHKFDLNRGYHYYQVVRRACQG